MSGNRFLVDTNIILYLLEGKEEVAEILDGTNIYISFITELELLGFKGITKSEKEVIKNVLENFIVVDINNEIKENTILIRSELNLKLPDSIIAATAMFLNLTLFSADKEFRKVNNLSLLLFENS